MAIDDKIKALTKQLYPTGRVWRVNPNSIKEKFINGLLASEIRAYNDAVSILDSTLPDNPNFTDDDASAWEKRLGLPDGTGIPLDQRMDAIRVQLNWPGTNPAKGAEDYLQDILNAAGYDVCVHENLFSSGGINDFSFTSTNSTNESKTWDMVTYGNGLFVGGSVTGEIMTSPDGITWTARTSVMGSCKGGAYGNGLFVVVGGVSGSNVMTSSDGITWTLRSTPANIVCKSICFGNNLFVAVGAEITNTQVRIMTSPDGIIWTEQSHPSVVPMWYVAYGNGIYVAIENNSNNVYLTSPDGITWTSRVPIVLNKTWSGIVFGNGIFVQTGLSGTALTSADGINWTSRNMSSTKYWYAVAFGNGVFIAVTAGYGAYASSPDGITWTETSLAGFWFAVTFGNNTVVAVGGSNTKNVVYGILTPVTYFHKTYAEFAGINLVRHISTLLHGQQRHGYLSKKGIIVANSVDPSVDDNFDIGDGSNTIFIGGCPPGTFINIPKSQETAFRQFILKIKPTNVVVLLLVNYV